MRDRYRSTEWPTIGVPVELHKTIADLARRQDRSLAAVVKRAIHDYSAANRVAEIRESTMEVEAVK